MARKTSEMAVLDRRVQGNFLRAGVVKWRKSDEMAAKRYKRRFVTERCDGRFSYKWVDSGGDREKSAEKLTMENKFHVKQNFAARVSHETYKRSEKPKNALFSGVFRCENEAKSGGGEKFRVCS